MSRDRDEPWSDRTCNGFAGGKRSPEVRGAARRRPRVVIMAGVAAALAAGVSFGLWARPDLDGALSPQERPSTKTASKVSPSTSRAPANLQVEVIAPKAVRAPAATGRMDVLQPEIASQTQTAAPQPRRAPAPELEPPSQVANAPTTRPAPAVLNDRAPAVRDASSVNPSFNCLRARSAAEQMVCHDQGLARLDQRLDRAFREAVASGTPYRELRDEQDDWLRIREDAARHSPAAVASVYRQRIAELRDLGEPD